MREPVSLVRSAGTTRGAGCCLVSTAGSKERRRKGLRERTARNFSDDPENYYSKMRPRISQASHLPEGSMLADSGNHMEQRSTGGIELEARRRPEVRDAARQNFTAKLCTQCVERKCLQPCSQKAPNMSVEHPATYMYTVWVGGMNPELRSLDNHPKLCLVKKKGRDAPLNITDDRSSQRPRKLRLQRHHPAPGPIAAHTRPREPHPPSFPAQKSHRGL